MLLHGGDRQNALMRVLQLQPRLLRLDGSRLDEKDAGDDLQAVGDAVLHLLQQHLLFPHQLFEPPLDATAVSNILERQQDGAVGALFVKYLANVQQHDAPADHRKFAIDFVSFDRFLILRDRLQKIAQLGDIPLAAVDIEQHLAAEILTGELEGLVERPAGGGDALILVEHEERIAHGINDGMRKRERDSIRNVNKWRILRQRRREHVNLSPRFRTRAKQRGFSLSWRERRDAIIRRLIDSTVRLYLCRVEDSFDGRELLIMVTELSYFDDYSSNLMGTLCPGARIPMP